MQHLQTRLIFVLHLPHRSFTLNIMLLSLPFHLLSTSPFKLLVILSCTHHSVASFPLSQPPSSFTLSLRHSASMLPFFPSRMSMGHHCHAVLWCSHSFRIKHKHTPHTHTHTHLVFFLSLPPHLSFLLVRYWGFWSLLSGGTGGQLNIYGSTFIQMFGNGESLWRKTDMTCLCTTCSRGRAELVLSMCQCVCTLLRWQMV